MRLSGRAARLREAAAVHRVADDGVFQMRQVQANLMGAAGLELALTNRYEPESARAPDSA